MTLDQIKEIVAQGESHTFEFKKSTALLHAAFKTVCAFLNGEGGTVFIGVTDQGKIIGQEVSDKTQREIAEEISKLEPSAQSYLSIDYVPVDNRNKIIFIKVKAGGHIPYAYDGRPYHRVQSTSPKMPQHRYEQLIIKRGQLNHAWDSLIAIGSKPEDLNHDLVLSIVNQAVNNKELPASAINESTSKILERFKLVRDHQIINAAMVLFGKDLPLDYPQCQIKLARFKGVNKREFLDSHHLNGNIFELLEQGELFIKRHLPVAAKVVPEQFRRIETPIIPFDAIREALLNALAHRDYSIREGTINIAIYDNRLELYSNGGLPPGVTLEKIKHGFSKPRNYCIADVLHKCGYIETWGRGIQNIIELCKEARVPKPQFFADDLEFKVIFKFPHSIKPELLKEVEMSRDNLTTRQTEIVEILGKLGEASAKKLKQSIKIALSERTLYRELITLRNMGIIASKGSTTNAVWYMLKNK
ncbi:MAG: hypothetical protein A2X78_01970 [Gammaproteobacteria bacterium GWE2_37_16]|nr:MAG: hypothetical protein A2X78_01970 [Gammaproteobacteria bacterium GWE2_37_16]